MRIAVVAPLFEAVPPKQYGGTERVAHWLIEEHVALGHDVTLYACAGSKTSARLIESWDGTLREQGISDTAEETIGPYRAQIRSVFSDAPLEKYDIVHIHHSTHHYHPKILESFMNTPVVWTDHNGFSNQKLMAWGRLAKLGIGFTALTEAFRSLAPNAPWLRTIHHGLPRKLLTPSRVEPTYLGFLGRISPEKGIIPAIRIAAAARHKLKVAAKVDKVDFQFYQSKVKHMFEHHNVEFIGEISDKEKAPFLSGCIALLFPIAWDEPFGLVMIEAMACGCPVIAYRKGSVVEVLEDGLTGFIVDNEEQAAEAIRKAGQLDRARIRRRFEERFTSTRMAKQYVEVYEDTIRRAKASQPVKELAKDTQMLKAPEVENRYPLRETVNLKRNDTAVDGLAQLA